MSEYVFNISDFTSDLEQAEKNNPPRSSELDKWPFATMGLPAALTVRLGRGSVRFRDRDPSKPGTRSYDASISAPAMLELNGVKYSSFIEWWTGSEISLMQFVKLMSLLDTQDPLVAAARLQGSTLDAWFKVYSKGGYDNLSCSNPKFLEVPNLTVTDTSTVRVNDSRSGASKPTARSASSSLPSSASATSSLPAPAPAPAASATAAESSDDELAFWETES